MTTELLKDVAERLARDNSLQNLAEVEAELRQLVTRQLWTSWSYQDLKAVYMRLDNLSGRPEARAFRDQGLVDQLKHDISGEVWKIANVTSPRYDDPESARRRSL